MYDTQFFGKEFPVLRLLLDLTGPISYCIEPQEDIYLGNLFTMN